MENRIKIESLQRTITVEKPQKTVLKVGPVSLDISGNKIIGVFGQKESGKRTFIQLLSGIKYSDSGVVIFNEKTWFKNELAYIPSEFPFNSKMKVKDIITTYQTLYWDSWNDDKWKYFLIRYNIDPTLKVLHLSLEMKQQLIVAVSLSHNAKILIIDEPKEGFEPFIRNEIYYDIIKCTYEYESITFISTDDTEVVNDVVDHILYFEQGSAIINASKFDFPEEANRILNTDNNKMNITEFVEEYNRRNQK